LPIEIEHEHYRRGMNSLDNVIAALERRDRITYINFRLVSNDEMDILSASLQEPFPVLTDLYIVGTPYSKPPILSETFLGGSAPRLQSCTLECVTFPALCTLLTSASRLTHLSLFQVPKSEHISPEAMLSCLATLTNLESFMLEFQSSMSSISHTDMTSPHPPTSFALPALTSFRFEGDNTYLEDLVARIDAPILHELTISFSTEPPFAVPQLYEFIARSQLLRDARRATVELYHSYVSMTDESGDEQFYLKSRFRAQKVSEMAQLCSDLSPLLSHVKFLEIISKVWQDPRDPALWLKIFGSFVSVESLIVSEFLVPVVADVLREATKKRIVEELPVLCNLVFKTPVLSRSIRDDIQVFLDVRRLSGRPVVLM
jgi:hypothetical protein